MAVIYRHANSPRPSLEGDLEDWQPVLDKMLAVKPEERFQSVAEVVESLEALTAEPA
jgi:hypothetical protein